MLLTFLRLFLFIIFLYYIYLNYFKISEQSQFLEPKLIHTSRSQRIVVIADVHGDYDNAIAILKMAGVIDEEGKWAGGNFTTFVQTGDIVDRGPDTIRLYELLERLFTEASLAEGQVVALNGNHEYMNLKGDWRYVTDKDIESFGGVTARRKAFEQDGFIGEWLYARNMTALINDTVFCHGGIRPDFARKGLDWINAEASSKLPEWAQSGGRHGDENGVFGANGPTWYRGYALENEDVVCPLLEEALAYLGAQRMVVGHTVMPDGKIISRCNGRIIIIDVGISAAYGGYRAALEIVGDQVRALYPDHVEILKTVGPIGPLVEGIAGRREFVEIDGYIEI